MKIEVSGRNDQANNKITNEKEQGNELFESIFNKNLKTNKKNSNPQNIKSTVKSLGENVQTDQVVKRKEKLEVSLKQLVELEKNITKPQLKKELSKLIDDLIIENKNKIVGLKETINLKEIKEKISNGKLEIKVEVKVEQLTKSIDSLEKKNKQLVDLNSDPTIKVAKEEVEKPKNKRDENQKNDLNKELNFIQRNEEQTEKTEVKHLNSKRINKNEENDSTNIFEEIKKQRIEIQNSSVNKEVVITQHSHQYNWQIASVKENPMKIGDWISSFKQEIDKLADFRIENRQKVSMFLKEQGEQLRIVVEKRDSYILVEADITDSMKDKLDGILSEVKSEMRDKGIEVKIEIKQNKESDEEKNKKENQSQGGKQNNDGSRQRNKSN